ncbi:MAG: mechanosensitive ion channel family protein, partial [Bacteroidota bacterium]
GGYDEVDNLASPLSIIMLGLLFMLAISSWELPNPVQGKITQYTKGILTFAITILCYRLGDALSFYIHKRTTENKISFNLALLPVARVTFQVLVVIVGILFTLQSLQFDIKGLLTGVGIGGLGFALASQDTIKNFFGSLVVLTDKPFDVGDFIVSGAIEGKVEEIGFRSTRIHTTQGSTMYVPNSKLADAHVNNYGVRQYKRFSTTIAIAYNTPIVLIEAFVEGLRKIVEHHPTTSKGKYAIYLHDLRSSVLEIIFQVQFNSTDRGKELQSRHELLLGIMRLAAVLGVRLAFPTQTLHMETFPEKNPFTPEYTTDPTALKQRLQAFLVSKNQDSRSNKKGKEGKI